MTWLQRRSFNSLAANSYYFWRRNLAIVRIQLQLADRKGGQASAIAIAGTIQVVRLLVRVPKQVDWPQV